MTQFLRTRPSWLGGPTTADAREPNWRRVPKISVVPGERASVITPLVLALLALLVVEAIVLQHLYRGLQDTSDRVAAATRDLDRVEGLVSTESNTISGKEQEIAALDAQIEQLGTQQDMISKAFNELTAGRTDWGNALDVLLRTDSPEVRFDKIVGQPGGKVDVTGTAEDVAAFGTFQDHMSSVDDILFLQDSGFEEGDSHLVFTADIEVR